MPRPSTIVMPAPFIRPPSPFTTLSTIVRRFFWTWSKSIEAFSATTPRVLNWPLSSCQACADWIIAFVGMQPTFRQVPPTHFSSTQTTDAPSCVARRAAG